MTTVPPSRRLSGFDVARALAVFGMILVNFPLAMQASENGPRWLVWLAGLLSGRAAATFVVLAGVGVSLMARRARLSGDIGQRGSVVRRLLKRSLFLFVAGLAYIWIWPADILHYYGVYLIVGAALAFASDRALWLSLASTVVLYVPLILGLDYEAGWDFDTLTYTGFWTAAGFVRNLFFNGFHPVVPWVAFLLAGVWLGRQDLTDRGVRGRLLAGSATVTLVSEGASAVILRYFRDLPAETYEIVEAMAGREPMPPMPLYMLQAGGTAVFCVVLCIALARRAEDTRIWKILAATGRMALTIYVAHVVLGMGLLEGLGLLDGRATLAVALGAATLFSLIAAAASTWWLRRRSQGPLEWAMRKISG